MPKPDRLLTPGEVADLLRVDPKTVARWSKAGKLDRALTFGGHGRFRESDVRRMLADSFGPDSADELMARVLKSPAAR
jgi:excisionase family DNA binding protein